MDVEEVLRKHKELVDRKFQEYNGLVSRETAAILVAQEMGLEIAEETTPELEVSDLIPGMRRVSLTGKVIAAGPLEEYSRRDGTQGHVQRLMMQDDSDRVEVVFWDPPSEELKAGQVLRIRDGYVKNFEEALQLNVSDRGSVEILESEPLQLSEVLDGAERLPVRASVLHVYPDKLFEAKRGGVFRASSLTLFQDALKGRVVFWEEEAELPSKVRPFQEVELTNLRVSVDDSGLVGLTASTTTSVFVRGEVEPTPIETLAPHEITHPELDIAVRGIVSSITKQPERMTIVLSDQLAELQLVILHKDAIESLKALTQGSQLSAKCVDVVQTATGELEARSSIWSEFSLE